MLSLRRGRSSKQPLAAPAITEYWTYDRGTQAAPVIVTIRDGKIRSIKRDRS